MPNTNLENSKTNMKTRIRNRVQAGQTPRDLGRLAKSARFVGLTDDAEVESDIDTQMAAAIPAASIDDLVEMSEGLAELRTGSADMGRVSNTDNLTEGGNKFLKASNVQPAISVSGDLSYDSGVVSYTAPTSAALQVVATVGDLPTGASPGDQAVVQSNNKLYIRTADGWYATALINTAPTVSGNDATYTLATDGSPTVITLTAVDPENDPVSFSHSVTSGDLNGTTVDQTDNVFTITPHASQAATFELTFSADDSVNVTTAVSSFSLVFGLDWSSPTQIGSNRDYELNYVYEQNGFYTYNAYIDQWPGGGSQSAFGSYSKNGKSWMVFGDSQVRDASTDTRGFIAGLALHDPYGFEGNNGGNFAAARWSFKNPNIYTTPHNYDNFGHKVAVSPSGTYVAVSAQEENAPQLYGRSSGGRAYLYNIDTNTYTTIDDPNISHVGMFGQGIAVSDTHTAVGKTDYSEQGGGMAGRVHIFDNATGNFLAYVTHDSTTYQRSDYPQQSWQLPEDGDLFGANVVMNNEYLCVAAENEQPVSGHNGVGAVYVYDMADPSNPSFLYKLQPTGYSGANAPTSMVGVNAPYQMNHKVYFGGSRSNSSMVISGNKLAVGAPGHFTNTPRPVAGNYSGSSVFGWDGTGYNQGPEESRGGKIFIYDLTSGNLITEIEHPQNYGYSNISGSLGGAYSLGHAFAFDGDVVVAGRGRTRDVDVYSASDGSIITTLVDAAPFTGSLDRPPVVFLQDNYIVALGKTGGSNSGGMPIGNVWKA